MKLIEISGEIEAFNESDSFDFKLSESSGKIKDFGFGALGRFETPSASSEEIEACNILENLSFKRTESSGKLEALTSPETFDLMQIESSGEIEAFNASESFDFNRSDSSGIMEALSSPEGRDLMLNEISGMNEDFNTSESPGNKAFNASKTLNFKLVESSGKNAPKSVDLKLNSNLV